jgi:hypothetical protein
MLVLNLLVLLLRALLVPLKLMQQRNKRIRLL